MNADMTTLPALVSIVIPVFNDEDTIAAALESAVNQTLAQIEIIVVDDASSDKTADIVASYLEQDSRIRLIRQPENLSGFQARRAGIFAAQAPYILFLDGDDELDRHAAAKSATAAEAHKADMLQFGIKIIYPNGKSGDSWEQRSQPKHRELFGDEILPQLFPPHARAAGQLWKYLFRTEILRAAYELTPRDARFYRANDLPIAFLAALIARRYASIPDRLYHYYWRRGSSALQASDKEAIEFQVGAIDAFDSTTSAVREAGYRSSDPVALIESHVAARLSIIGIAMRWALDTPDSDLFRFAISEIEARVGKADMVRAATRHQPAVLERLAQTWEPPVLGAGPVRNVLITAANLTTGGVSMVVLAQAAFLAESGYGVTIAVRRPGNDLALVPEGVAFYEVTAGALADKVDLWADICEREEIDVIIDHRILYSTDWHAYALTAAARDIPTIGWIHNFAGRPTYDLNAMHGFLKRCLPSLAQVVTLSPLDVAFWKLRGIAHTSYLPNPPSPMLLKQAAVVRARTAPRGRLELIWIGRLEQHTKQVRELLGVAAELRTLEVDFRLRVVGPDQPDYTAEQLNAAAAKAGLASYLEAVGPLQGADLVAALDSADAFVGTSIIEGYQLTIVEAQSRGLPVFMYDMPWLLPVQDNRGVVSVPQGQALALAQRIATSLSDADAYEELSQASLIAARRSLDVDYSVLYRQLVNGELPEQYSPSASVEQASELLDLTIFFAEQHSGIRQKLQKAERSSKAAALRTEKLEKKVAYLRRQLESGQNQLPTSSIPPRDRGTSATDSSSNSARYRRALKRARLELQALLSSDRRRARVTAAAIEDGTLTLTLRAPKGMDILDAQLRRKVADGFTVLPLVTVPQDVGAYTASHDARMGMKRRWRVAATVRSGDSVSLLDLPVDVKAEHRGDAHFGVRFHDRQTVQFFRRNG